MKYRCGLGKNKGEMSIDEIIDDLIANLPESSLSAIAEMKCTEIGRLHFGLGMYIRNTYGLWEGNPLTENWRLNQDSRDIRNGVDYSSDHPDAVSGMIIDALWERVTGQKTLKPNDDVITMGKRVQIFRGTIKK